MGTTCVTGGFNLMTPVSIKRIADEKGSRNCVDGDVLWTKTPFPSHSIGLNTKTVNEIRVRKPPAGTLTVELFGSLHPDRTGDACLQARPV